MKRAPSSPYLRLGLAAIALALVVPACSTPNRHRMVDAGEFLELAQTPSGPALHTEWIGMTDTRAFLHVWSAMPSSLGGGDHVCSVALDDLPSEVRERLKAGTISWAR